MQGDLQELFDENLQPWSHLYIMNVFRLEYGPFSF